MPTTNFLKLEFQQLLLKVRRAVSIFIALYREISVQKSFDEFVLRTMYTRTYLAPATGVNEEKQVHFSENLALVVLL